MKKIPQQWDGGATHIRRVGWGRGHALGLKSEPLVASTATVRELQGQAVLMSQGMTFVCDTLTLTSSGDPTQGRDIQEEVLSGSDLVSQ